MIARGIKTIHWRDYELYRVELYIFYKKKPSTVVIKRLRTPDLREDVFLKDLQILTSVKHYSILSIVGFCTEESEGILVVENFYEYVDEYVKDVKNRRNLTWEKRLNICIDVAHALDYLQCGIIDQKKISEHLTSSGYIALDENFRAKIVDLEGVTEIPPLDQKTRAFNDVGNLAKVVPGFVVVLFKILCAPLTYEENDAEGLISVARLCFNTGMLQDMMDPIILEEIGNTSIIGFRGPNKDSFDIFIKIARECLVSNKSGNVLPKTKFVITELEKALDFHRNNNANLKIPFQRIKLATRDFHHAFVIGGGGFWKVYFAKLTNEDGSYDITGAKRLYGRGKEQFLTELQILWEYKHDNIIRLVGCCDENDEKIIVYEYAYGGSLDSRLNDDDLTWLKRLTICIDIASPLVFLHGGAGKQAKVVHNDIKTANILLCSDERAKLADFGLSMISAITKPTDHVFDHACGTPGYLDPLYAKSKILTLESDIYSFGIVLFEILCGRSTHTIYEQEGHYLPDFVKTKFEEGKHGKVVFEKIREKIVPKSLTTFQEIAYQCLHHEREKRPSANEVLRELKKALEYRKYVRVK